ncbi:indole-3-glycerol phosphate synthase TrpC [Mammaliicoccus vitulinus]|uniref:indole-3-glycerol phosphate synthase TrpC n=1 Tax=Mammaliicoccus vitulinus TaxID=71237 RepID=UPI000E677B8C|nr:indole-3-glycerol phosphate synthase TrpC [Mammaliicoccus vitulinus]RIN14060.1 indole-3-glycerol phosphate synthase TrpC [Mammaliicoccus vitulinus]RIN22264.1 indole-3-glycerol phosphate synthase TrpC [Mammaliicoccus vitulinus]
MTILDEIVEYKKHLLDENYYEQKLEALDKVDVQHKTSFLSRVKNDHQLNIIAELKAKSPTVSDIPKRDMATQIKLYEQHGASAISILTDEKYFDGSYERLQSLTTKTTLPVLCKDFIIDKRQIDLAYHVGASIVLLIVNILTKEELKNLYDYAISKGLEVLVEVHDKAELAVAHEIDAALIGVNNRDLKRFVTNVKHTNEILKSIKPGVTYISESGIRTLEDVESIIDSGIDGALIGESLMKHPNLEVFLPSLRLKKQGDQHVH